MSPDIITIYVYTAEWRSCSTVTNEWYESQEGSSKKENQCIESNTVMLREC